MPILLLMSMLALEFDIQRVKASGTIYIRADGSVDPDTAPISTVDNITYMFTDNIYDEIVVEKDNIVVNGAGCTLQGEGDGTGISLSGRSNVTIKNIEIESFWDGISLSGLNNIIFGNSITGNWDGIWLYESSDNIIFGNSITGNWDGIVLSDSSNNTISRNSITNNVYNMEIYNSSYNSISGNNITNSQYGIWLYESSDNIIFGNSITKHNCGIVLEYSHNNKFYHNNFINNTNNVILINDSLNNDWDNGYPSGGNYWSNYTGTDHFSGPGQNEAGSDGIGDTPHIINANNADNYPLINPWTNIAITNVSPCKTIVGEGYSLPINVTVENQGHLDETFDVTAYYNMTSIVPTQRITLTSGGFITITFEWSTTGVAKGNYTISACANPVLGETDTTDNTLADGWIIVAMVGDITGGTANPWEFVPDGKVGGIDLTIVAKCFGSWPEAQPPMIWHPNCDIDNDKKVSGVDLTTVAKHLGEADP